MKVVTCCCLEERGGGRRRSPRSPSSTDRTRAEPWGSGHVLISRTPSPGSDPDADVRARYGPFDCVFGDDCCPSHLYRQLLAPHIPAILQGSSMTVFGLGEGCSRKRALLWGPDGARSSSPTPIGLVSQFVHDLLQGADAQPPERRCRLDCGLLQVRDAILIDQLDPRNTDRLLIDEIDSDGVQVRGLTRFRLWTSLDLDHVLARARSPSIGRHGRSPTTHHTVLQLQLSAEQGRVATVSFVVAADTEAVFASAGGPCAGGGREAARDFAAVSRAVRELGRGRSFLSHRSARLTHLLKDSLSPGSIWVVLGAVRGRGPAPVIARTAATLRFVANLTRSEPRPRRRPSPTWRRRSASPPYCPRARRTTDLESAPMSGKLSESVREMSEPNPLPSSGCEGHSFAAGSVTDPWKSTKLAMLQAEYAAYQLSLENAARHPDPGARRCVHGRGLADLRPPSPLGPDPLQDRIDRLRRDLRETWRGLDGLHQRMTDLPTAFETMGQYDDRPSSSR